MDDLGLLSEGFDLDLQEGAAVEDLTRIFTGSRRGGKGGAHCVR